MGALPSQTHLRSFRLYHDGALFAEAKAFPYDNSAAAPAQASQGSTEINGQRHTPTSSKGASRRALLQSDNRYPVSGTEHWPNNAIALITLSTNQSTGTAASCTGTWISGMDVLTAAHCVSNWDFANNGNPNREYSQFQVRLALGS